MTLASPFPLVTCLVCGDTSASPPEEYRVVDDGLVCFSCADNTPYERVRDVSLDHAAQADKAMVDERRRIEAEGGIVDHQELHRYSGGHAALRTYYWSQTAPPTPPDHTEEMARRMYEWAVAMFDDTNPRPPWTDLPDEDRERWIEDVRFAMDATDIGDVR